MAALRRFGTRHPRGSTATNGVSATLGDGPIRRIPLAGALLTAAACGGRWRAAPTRPTAALRHSAVVRDDDVKGPIRPAVDIGNAAPESRE